MTRHWLKTAPERLVQAHQNREINNGRVILERLLCDQRMQYAWKELTRQVTTNQQWIDVWLAIAYAKSKSNKANRRKPRSDERDDYQTLANKCASIANKIENGPLDILAYELFPQDVLKALHIGNFHDMDSLQRCDIAHKLLPRWPSAPELLRGLEKYALMLADDAMNKPRADERDSGDVNARIFVWHLGHGFIRIFKKPMHGTLARITDVALDRAPDKEISRSFVQSVLRGV